MKKPPPSEVTTLEPFSPLFLHQLQQLKIHTRRAFLGSRQGSHRSLRRGHGLEFADFRAYAPGDDFRHIDWGVLARSDRLYVREFREEQDLNVLFLVDTSPSMAFPAGRSKLSFALSLGLALAYIALSNGDRVSFSLLGQGTTPRFSGARSFQKAFAALSRVAPGAVTPIAPEVRKALAAQKIPGKCFFLSDFLFDTREEQEAVDLVRMRNFDLTLIQILSPEEISPDSSAFDGVLIDSESSEELELPRIDRDEYGRLLKRHIGTLEDHARSVGIRFLSLASSEAVSTVVLTKFTELGILR